MFVGEEFQEAAHRLALTPFRLIEAATDVADRVQKIVVVEESLIGLCALHNQLGLTIDGQNGGVTRRLERLDMDLRVSLKVAQGMDVGEVDGHNM